ncbi:MAG: tetratricopeptide repeat protein [Bacteroidia bacterium]|nr:tetratricopeptide repeat protein [Bacteroidia bacterium]NNK72917.1 tetratricopeptide repeat protein [Flavobacteriaceae bacterium]
MSKFFNELKRRHVIKAAIAYLVVAWVLLQVATILLDIFNSPDWVKQAFTLFLIIGLPIWIVISWIYDFTPKGVEKTTEEPEDRVVRQITNKRLNLFIIVSLIIAVIILAIKPSFLSSDTNRDYSIAVIPFENIKVDEDKEWLSQNFFQSINSYISKVKELKVIDPYSSRQYEGTAKTNAEIGEELDVAYILRGYVTQLNNKLSITIDLIDVISNTVHWSESYDENLVEDPLKLPQEVSQKIVAQLRVALTPEDEKVLDNLLTKNLEASRYFNEGVRTADKRAGNSDSLLVVSANYLQKAIDLDPDYADAYAEKAFVLRLLNEEDEFFKNSEKLKKIDSLLEISLEIDPNNARAFTAIGMNLMGVRNYDEAKEYFDKALAIKPNDATANHYSALYFVQNPNPDYQKSLEHISIAYKLNPFSVPINMTIIMESLRAGKIVEAEAIYKKNSHILPKFLNLIAKTSIIDAKIKKVCIEKKDWAEAINLYHREIELDTINSYLYRTLAVCYKEILNDDVNAIKYAKKAYELGELYSQNADRFWMSSNADAYFFALLKNKEFDKANNLLLDDYFRSLFSVARLFYLESFKYYYQGNYAKALDYLDKYQFDKNFELCQNYAQQNDIKKVNSMFDNVTFFPTEKAIVFAILKERDSMYYYLEKEKRIEYILNINGSIELDPYRKEERYKTILKENYIPLTEWNE